MKIDDLHLLPKVRDSGSFLYLERGYVEQDGRAVMFVNERGRIAVPIASLSLLMLGPGTTITHRAIVNAAECGCSVTWVGEEGVRMYAAGLGATRSARWLLKQVALHQDERARMGVVRQMYDMRFVEPLPAGLTLRQVRGAEGARVRDTYRRMSGEYGVPWAGREYRRSDWSAATPINRALSAANACLYGICHAAIVSIGCSPALGFVHTGKALSFVYDVADIYKTETSIPAAFLAAASGASNVDSAARHALREQFHATRLLGRIVDDIGSLLGGRPSRSEFAAVDADLALPGELWDPTGGVAGGLNYEEDA